MPSEEFPDALSAGDRELESALARLTPAAVRIDARDLLLRAQQARTARRTWAYRAVAAILAVALLISLLIRPKPVVRETVRTVLITAPPPTIATNPNPPSAAPPGMVEELRVCQELADKGLAALPPAPAAAASDGNHPPPPLSNVDPLWN